MNLCRKCYQFSLDANCTCIEFRAFCTDDCLVEDDELVFDDSIKIFAKNATTAAECYAENNNDNGSLNEEEKIVYILNTVTQEKKIFKIGAQLSFTYWAEEIEDDSL